MTRCPGAVLGQFVLASLRPLAPLRSALAADSSYGTLSSTESNDAWRVTWSMRPIATR